MPQLQVVEAPLLSLLLPLPFITTTASTTTAVTTSPTLLLPIPRSNAPTQPNERAVSQDEPSCTHCDDVDQRSLPRILQADERELHLLLEEKTANGANGDTKWLIAV